MRKIAILGCDSTHVEVFTSLLNGPLKGQASISAIWGEDREQTQAKAHALSIPKIASSPEDAMNGCDAAMVLSRYADNHIKLAALAVGRKVPVYVDKLLSESKSEAQAFLSAPAARQLVYSCSPYRHHPFLEKIRQALPKESSVSLMLDGPLICNDLKGDPRLHEIYFYGIHVAELVERLVGPELEFKSLAKGRNGSSLLFTDGKQLDLACYLGRHYPDENLRLTRLDGKLQFSFSEGIDEMYENTLRRILDFFSKPSGFAGALDRHLKAIEIVEQLTRGSL